MAQRFFPALAFLLVTGSAAAQITGGTAGVISISSMHDLIDARSMALGESVVARARTPLAWNSNPATLAGATGAGLDYASHTGDYGYRGGFTYSSAGAWAGTPIGTFALHYNKFDFGEFLMTFENGTTGPEVEAYNETIALSYATDLLKPVSIGATVKRFKDAFVFLSGDSAAAGTDALFNAEAAFYFDLGGIVSAEGFLDETLGSDSIHAGVAVQNLGGDYSYADFGQTVPVANWLRAGIAYDLGLLMAEKKPRLRASLTAEYRRMLNAPDRAESPSYWGVGLEATAFELLSVRLGTITFSRNNIYGEADVPVFRYGAGLDLPLSRLGIDQPLSLGVDYAFVPLRPSFAGHEPSPMNTFDIRVQYTASIF